MKRAKRWLVLALVPWMLACALLSAITEGDQYDSSPDPGPAQTVIATKGPAAQYTPLWWTK